MTRRLYVYYRVALPRLAETVAAVRSMQSALLAAHPGLRAELLRRPDPADGEVTLMETYAGGVNEAMKLALDAAAARLPQPRHNEWFDERV